MLLDSGYSLPELDWLVRHEGVRRLGDLVMRRTALAITGRLSRRDLFTIAQTCALALDWDRDRTVREVEATSGLLDVFHRLRWSGS